MFGYKEAGLGRLEAAHAPFRVGMRVRLNERFPYGGAGRLGTVTKLPLHLSAKHINVLFDDSPREVEYAKSYFDPVALEQQMPGKETGA